MVTKPGPAHTGGEAAGSESVRLYDLGHQDLRVAAGELAVGSLTSSLFGYLAIQALEMAEQTHHISGNVVTGAALASVAGGVTLAYLVQGITDFRAGIRHLRNNRVG